MEHAGAASKVVVEAALLSQEQLKEKVK